MDIPSIFRTRPGLPAGLVLLCALGAPGALNGQQALTLDEAVERALEYSPQMAQSRQQILNANESQRVALGAFLPTLSGSAGSSLRSTERFDPNTDRVVAGSSDSYNAGLSARYTIFSGGERFANKDAADADLLAAEAGLVDQRYAVVLNTQTVFFQALRQEELVEVAGARVDQAEESLRLTRRQAAVGAATSSDTLRARLEMANARQSLLQSEASLRDARVSLGRQVGIAGPVEAIAPEELEPRALSMSADEILALAEEQAPSVRAAAASSTAAAADVTAARTQYLPSISLGSGYNWANEAASFGGGATSWNLSLSMSYPIFNGFQRESQVARAQAAYEVVQKQEADARLAARAEADRALRTVETQAFAIEIAEEAVAVAEEDLRVVRARYQANVARIYDVVQSQVALSQARVDLVQARYDYVLALAELEAILGREL